MSAPLSMESRALLAEGLCDGLRAENDRLRGELDAARDQIGALIKALGALASQPAPVRFVPYYPAPPLAPWDSGIRVTFGGGTS